jgi:predicted ferric reductase
MMANLLNTLLGIGLVYAIILNPDLIGSPWRVVVIAIVIFALALWSRRTDYDPWQSSTNIVLALLLLLIGLSKFSPYISPLVNFWGIFWIGILLAILALWAAIYRPPSKPRFSRS